MAILDDILRADANSLATKIAAMAPATYNYTWGTVDEYRWASKSFPDAEIYIEPETGLDLGAENAVVDKYTNSTDIRILVRLDNTENVDLSVSKAIDDLKLLFDTELTNWQALGMIDFDYLGNSGPRYTHFDTRPVEVDVNFRITWRQSQNDPSST